MGIFEWLAGSFERLEGFLFRGRSGLPWEILKVKTVSVVFSCIIRFILVCYFVFRKCQPI